MPNHKDAIDAAIAAVCQFPLEHCLQFKAALMITEKAVYYKDSYQFRLPLNIQAAEERPNISKVATATEGTMLMVEETLFSCEDYLVEEADILPRLTPENVQPFLRNLRAEVRDVFMRAAAETQPKTRILAVTYRSHAPYALTFEII